MGCTFSGVALGKCRVTGYGSTVGEIIISLFNSMVMEHNELVVVSPRFKHGYIGCVIFFKVDQIIPIYCWS